MHADELEQEEREYNSRHAEQDMPYLEKPLLQPTQCANSKINNYIVDNRANNVNYQKLSIQNPLKSFVENKPKETPPLKINESKRKRVFDSWKSTALGKE